MVPDRHRCLPALRLQPWRWVLRRTTQYHDAPYRSRRAHNSGKECDPLSYVLSFLCNLFQDRYSLETGMLQQALPELAQTAPGRLCRAIGLFPRTADRRAGLQARTNEGWGELLIHLEAVTGRFAHENAVLIVHTHPGWPPEVLFSLHPVGALPLAPHLRIRVQLLLAPLGDRGITGPRRDKIAIRVEDLQPIVQPISHVDNAIVIHRNARGTIELARSRARLATLHQEPAIRAKLLNAVVAPVGNVHIALAVEVDTPGHIELAITAATCAPLRQESAIFGKFLNAVITAIHHVHIVIGIKRQTSRTVEFPVTCARALLPLADIVPILAEDGNAIEPFVGDVDIPVFVKGNGGRPDQGAIVEAKLVWSLVRHATGEGCDVLFVYRADGNPCTFGTILRGTAEHVQEVALTPGGKDRR